MNKKVRFSVMSALAAAMAAIAFGISADEPSTIEDGVYTEEQAEAGAELFKERCSACHNAEFYRGTFSNRNNQPLQYLFEEILVTMPADLPGSLMDHEYEQILAHILSLLDYPAGDKELSYSSGMMSDINIVPPK